MGLTRTDLKKFARNAYLFYRMGKDAYVFGIGTVIVLTLSTSIFAYFNDPEANAISLILGFCFFNIHAMVSCLFSIPWLILAILLTQYLMIRFRNLTLPLQHIQYKRKLAATKSVLDAFYRQFDEMCVFLATFNELTKYAVLFIYLIATPSLCMQIYLSVYGHVSAIVRFFGVVSIVEGGIAILGVNYQFSRINVEAHKPYQFLNSIIVRNTQLSTGKKLKVIKL